MNQVKTLRKLGEIARVISKALTSLADALEEGENR